MIKIKDLIKLNAILPDNISIKECIRSLDKSKLQIVLISKKNNLKKIIGTITDGDIRRSFIKGHNIETNITKVLSKKYFFCNPTSSTENASTIMKKKLIRHLPVLDNKNNLIGLHCLDFEERKTKKNIFFIMAGGFGKRLMPYTKNIPKPMLKLNGKPILYHIIKNAKDSGFYNFVISTHFKSDAIMDYFKDGEKFEINVKYIKEKEPLGTAGSIKYLQDKTNLPFIVTNGDMLTKLNYSDILEFHIKNKSLCTMAFRNHNYQNPYGVVKIKNSKIYQIIEKPISSSFINTGLYVFDPKICKHIPKRFINIPRNKI